MRVGKGGGVGSTVSSEEDGGHGGGGGVLGFGVGEPERACGIECRGLPGAAARERIEAAALL